MREALQKCHDLLESSIAHVSHGGPTRADAEAALLAAKSALQFDDLIGPIEQSLAYEHAASVIESHCVVQKTADLVQYYDLASAEIDVTEEAMYLDSRRLLERHPEHLLWVLIRDEDEPLPLAKGSAA
jgi:hypothetical protein